jgi:hypothetical protein
MEKYDYVPTPEILVQQPEWTWFMNRTRFPWTPNNPEKIQYEKR